MSLNFKFIIIFKCAIEEFNKQQNAGVVYLFNTELITGAGDEAFKNIGSASTGAGMNLYVSRRLGQTLDDLGTNVFEAANITSIKFDNTANTTEGVKSLGDYMFANCTKLTTLVIPKSITNLGKFVFAYCTGLGSLTKDHLNVDDYDASDVYDTEGHVIETVRYLKKEKYGQPLADWSITFENERFSRF